MIFLMMEIGGFLGLIAYSSSFLLMAKKWNINWLLGLLVGGAIGSIFPVLFALWTRNRYPEWVPHFSMHVYLVWVVTSIVCLVTAFLLPQKLQSGAAHEVTLPMPLPPGTGA